MCVTWAGGQAEKGKAEGGSEPGERQEGIASRRRTVPTTGVKQKGKVEITVGNESGYDGGRGEDTSHPKGGLTGVPQSIFKNWLNCT